MLICVGEKVVAGSFTPFSAVVVPLACPNGRASIGSLNRGSGVRAAVSASSGPCPGGGIARPRAMLAPVDSSAGDDAHWERSGCGDPDSHQVRARGDTGDAAI